MPQPPSAIDQVFRHWDPTWPAKPHHLVGMKPTVVQIQNVADYAHAAAIEHRKIPRIGCCYSPWDISLLYWEEPTLDLGQASKLAIIRQLPLDRETGEALICGIFLQRESKGGPVTVLSGMFSIVIPKGGLLETDEETGLQLMRMSVLGDPRTPLHHDSFAAVRPIAERLFGRLHVEAMAYAGLVIKTWAIDTQKDIQIVLSAFSFANCKNVVIAEAGRTSPPPRWTKEHGVPTVKYRVVKIDSRLVKRAGESAAETERFLSVHIRRGHMKTFTEEKKLFGKHVGSWWWEQVARGSPEAGSVEKTYELKS